MSITLPFVDLSSAVVGTTGTVALQPSGLVAVPGPHPPILQIYNDSGAGLLILLKVSQLQFYLPPKGHSMVAISNKEGELAYQVVNIATNIQVNQLWTVYFYPNEEVSNFSPLGTSTVSQQATTVLNVGNPFGQKIFFAQPVGDNGVAGATVITNSGQITLGDGFVGNGHISIVGPTLQDTQIDAGTLQMHDLAGNAIILLEANETVLNGGTSGTATLYQILGGTVKYVMIFLSNFRTAGANQNISFPNPFTQRAYIRTQDTDLFSLQASGVDVATRTMTGLPAAAAAAGTQVASTTMNGFGIFSTIAAFDSIQFKSGWAASHNSIIIIEGI